MLQTGVNTETAIPSKGTIIMKDIDFSIVEQVRIIALHLRGSDLFLHQILPLNKSDDLKNQDIEVEEQLCKFILTVISHKGCGERNRSDKEEIEHVEPKVFVIGLIENVCSPYSRDPDRSNNEEGYEVTQKLTPVWYFKR